MTLNGLVYAAFFHGDTLHTRLKGWSSFRGGLPNGITFGANQADTRNKLGHPSMMVRMPRHDDTPGDFAEDYINRDVVTRYVFDGTSLKLCAVSVRCKDDSD